ncbi:MAG: FAD-dependent oxidoreductase, partial [Pseudomonadota bacterium]|nr:FAD-dependent oxidoreductase [Pseudomonadota bacterium]
LTRAGLSVLLVEARERVGGRCLTRRMPGLAVPVELGAEFIHGRPQVTLDLLQRSGVPGVDSTRTQRFVERGRLRPIDAFAEAHKAMRATAQLKKHDLSFEAFLRTRKNLRSITRMFARMMVQGFDAADPARVSARDIAEEWQTALGSSQMRPQGGYGPLLESLVGKNTRLELGVVVREIRWKRGAVTLEGTRRGRPFRAQAPRAIVTLPLGVLQAGSVRFSPQLTGKQAALEKLASGPVIRVAMRFREAFWDERCPDVAFFHSPRAPFPTFWTPLPMRAPLLTAWAGGPKAARLTGSSEKELLRAALASVRSAFGRVPRIEAAYVQDWQSDPYARGGYSYVTVGGQGAREILRRPLEKTLFFAGEATDADEAGTVAGALRSGMRAARELLRA